MTQSSPDIQFDNSFAREMEGFFIEHQAEPSPSPELVVYNSRLGAVLGLDETAMCSEAGCAMMAGNQIPPGAQPVAQAYAGHQFGGFSPSLGDGRALLIGEIFDKNGKRVDIQLKGSGRTPFSRNGDGKAALGPVLREYLFSEAMYALAIPTTGSLAALRTGAFVYREHPVPGAILVRTASSHMRVGTFQYFAARGQADKVRQLADYAINRHDPDLSGKNDRYLRFVERVIERQISLITRWMSVGFIHGVMNTDNMTLSGETIDYGPCAFMDVYHPDTVFSSIDDHGRYAYAMQPKVAQWNLARLAESVLELLADGNRDMALTIATGKIETIPEIYKEKWLTIMCRKIGIFEKNDTDGERIEQLLNLMKEGKADFTRTFRLLSCCHKADNETLLSCFDEPSGITAWLGEWRKRLAQENTTLEKSKALMNKTNPVYIPRNHLVEEALNAAVHDANLRPFDIFMNLLKNPFAICEGMERYETGAPEGMPPHITYCGT